MKASKTISETGSAVAARKRVRDEKPKPAPGPVLTPQEARALLAALTALRQGDGSVRLPVEWTGVQGKIAETFNDVVELNERMAQELARLSRVVGKEGKLSQRLSLGDVSGFWQESVDSVNDLIDDLVHPTSETARVIGAVAGHHVEDRVDVREFVVDDGAEQIGGQLALHVGQLLAQDIKQVRHVLWRR